MNIPPLVFWSYLLTLAGLTVVILLVAAKNLQSKVYVRFILFALSVWLYVAASFGAEFQTNLDSALIYTRTALFFANFIPLAFLYFTVAFTNYKPKYKWAINSLYVLIPLFALTAYLPSNIVSIERLGYGTTLDEAGPLLLVTLIYFIVVFFYCFRILFKHSKTSELHVKLQIRMMVFGIGAAVIINLITQIVLPEFHIQSYGNILGVPSDLLLVGGISYAILRHRMFDIRAVVLRSLGYLTTLILIVCLYAAGFLFATRFLFPELHLSAAERIFFVIITAIFTLTAKPVITFVQKITNRLFYRDHYDPQTLINNVSRVLAGEIGLTKLSDSVRQVLSDHLRSSQVDIVVLANNKVYFEAGGFFKADLQTFDQDMHKLGEQTLVRDELSENDQKAIMRQYGISVFTALLTLNGKVGYLLLSDKRSGASYNNGDRKVIEIVADELAIAIQNSLAYTQIQEFNRTLQAKVDDATAQLRGANEQLKQIDATKDDFISMASHQLGTPLAVIDGYLSLAATGYYGKLDSKLDIAIKAALDRAEVMKHLLIDLLDISRMTANRFYLDIQPTDLNLAVSKEVSQLMRLAESHGVKLKYHQPSHPVPNLNIDEQKTRQAIMNLITNGIVYSNGGNVDVYLEVDDHYVRYRVVDNGIGVPEDQKPKLFTKFYRANNAKRHRPDGTGIGLYLVKRVIEDQKGKIIFESRVGKGSTFGFSLPLKSPLSVGHHLAEGNDTNE